MARAFSQTASTIWSLNGLPDTSVLGRRCMLTTFSLVPKSLLVHWRFEETLGTREFPRHPRTGAKRAAGAAFN
jgi:hypothetical protein